MLPGLSGPAVLRRIVQADPRQPVIILTAYATGERHEDLMLAGASEFLEKPVELTALREACARVLRHSEHLSASAEAAEAHVALTHIARRVQLADYSLSRGQTGHASHHLRNALALCERGELSDDEWAHLLHEAD
jgi:FixJ family two-component response regulator